MGSVAAHHGGIGDEFSLPIERLSKLHKRDAWHRRVLVESIVISAIAELLGTDPWHLAPDRFHPH